MHSSRDAWRGDGSGDMWMPNMCLCFPAQIRPWMRAEIGTEHDNGHSVSNQRPPPRTSGYTIEQGERRLR